MFKCPHCNKRSFSFFQKLGIVISMRGHDYQCKKCGRFVTVSFLQVFILFLLIGFLNLLPVFAFPEYMEKTDNAFGFILVFSLLFTTTILVPLRKKKV